MAFRTPFLTGAQPLIAVPVPERKPPPETRVTGNRRSAAAGSGTGNLDKGTSAPDIARNARQRHRDPPPAIDPPPGPPPAFKVSILDAELDLDLALARSRTTRGQSPYETSALAPLQPAPMPSSAAKAEAGPAPMVQALDAKNTA